MSNEDETTGAKPRASRAHIMVDIETGGKRPNAAIMAIGAVAFDAAGMVGIPFYVRVNLESSMARGTVDGSTIRWWMTQSDEARAEVATATMHIGDALTEFAQWVHSHNPVGVWGNGATFDNVILRSAFVAWGVHCPWQWWQDRCFRTIKAALGGGVPMPPETTKHRADHDARWQADALVAIAANALKCGIDILAEGKGPAANGGNRD